MRLFPRFAFACPLFLTSVLTAGELKVDINRDGKNTVAQTAAGYTQWATAASVGSLSTGTAPITRSFPIAATGENVTVSFAMTEAGKSAGGTGLTYTYHGPGSLSEDGKLVSDGLTVAPSVVNGTPVPPNGGQIQMTITGLAAGKHSLLTFHNAGDSAAQLVSVAPMKAYLNDALVTTVTPSIRSTDNATPTAYFTFSTKSPDDVTTILFEADNASSATTKNVVINGFEIDTSNSDRKAGAPSPKDANQEVDVSGKKVTLSWAPAVKGGAVSHDIYFDSNQTAVETATRASSAFIGNQTETSRVVTVSEQATTYYWRIDEVDALGNVTPGSVWTFGLRPSAADYSQTVFVCLGGKDKRGSVISIPAPGHGWNYSAVAPVVGEQWNRIKRTDGVPATEPTVAAAANEPAGKLGSQVLDMANVVPLVDPTGKPTKLNLTVQIEVNALASDKPRTEPNVHSKSKQAMPAGLMDTSWRVYLPQNSLTFVIGGCTPGQYFDLYCYGGAIDPATNPDGAKDGARFTLAAPNVVMGSATAGETTGGFYASIHTYTEETDKITPSPSGSTWIRLPAVADAKGQIRFSTARNINGRHFVNGFQLVPRAKP